MYVELGSRIDDRGTILYNLNLSNLSANSIVDSIDSKRIDGARNEGICFGKSQLIWKPQKGPQCTTEGNREDRRNEINSRISAR